jgi:hypothetical protein
MTRFKKFFGGWLVKRFRKMSIFITAATLGSSAFAIPPLAEGWYVEGNLGSSRITNITYASGNSVTRTGRGYNINLGYKFIPFFAAELGYTNYAQSTGSINGVKIASDTHYSYDIATKAMLPIADSGFELFAKLGAAQLKNKIKVENQSYVTTNGIVVNSGSNSVTGLYFGLGADYTFAQGVSFNGQWQRAKGNNKTGNYDLFSLGLSYIFA